MNFIFEAKEKEELPCTDENKNWIHPAMLILKCLLQMWQKKNPVYDHGNKILKEADKQILSTNFEFFFTA